MNLFQAISAALLLALLVLSPALDPITRYMWGDAIRRRFAWRQFWLSETGAVTVSYYIRGGNGVLINGSTTPPTAVQAAQCQKQSAVVVMGVTADVQALFTHNMGLDVSAPTYFEPELLQVAMLSLNTYQPAITFDWTNTNVLVMNKPATDAPIKVLITIRRPHSVGQ